SVAGLAPAQTAADTTNTPQRAGEASTMTGGAPNAKTSNEGATDKPAGKSGKAAKGQKAAGKHSAAATSNVPDRAGEASTMTGGAPNKKTTN
ncbi:MAG TPA: hypothetical protein VNB23_06995, partial [Ramlibacter sp.]|nr:hypothetical protein [Ramlibacter sp.]